ncbi:MAG: hypothetical protein CDV28_10638 [Candidatus Electronema aureum]|uniref:Uncharacterized protein n=1 Tax=Candidatus Electronema aureum TaxID=2005002 RepID=A0A521G3D3_9BACT|nr:MAG: hypothetical protein CDV28_10638 [Candidatus Electronema aureum]
MLGVTQLKLEVQLLQQIVFLLHKSSVEQNQLRNSYSFLIHLNFNVAKAIKPRMIEIIQKRTTTLGSVQPFFSK